MIIVCHPNAAEDEIVSVVWAIEAAGLVAHRSDGVAHTIVGVVGDKRTLDRTAISMLPGVREVVDVSSPFKLASREFHPADTIVRLGEVAVGGLDVVVIAGPCAVESEPQIGAVAKAAAGAGARVLWGGAYKPRRSTCAFEGHGEAALRWLREAADRHGLAVVTEVMVPEQIELVGEYADGIRIGASNMQNTALLAALGQTRRPVLLERGTAASILEWLQAAECVLAEGNLDVILCERGIRTFETATRNTLDLSAIPVVDQLSHLPIVVDPSHGTGDRRFVEAMARAAIAAGADGIMVEAHPCPRQARCEGPQSLDLEELAVLTRRCRIIAAALGRPIAKETAT